MPTYDVTSPDGKKYRVTAPEGATQQDAIQYVQKNQPKLTAATSGKTPPVHQMGTLESIGTGMRDPIEGLAQGLTHVLPTGVVRAGNKFNNWLRDQGVPLAEMPTGDDVTLDKS